MRDLKKTVLVGSSISAFLMLAAVIFTEFFNYGLIISMALMFGLCLVTLQEFSKRLWYLQSLIELSNRSVPIQSAIEADAALKLQARFPNLQVPTTSYTIRFSNALKLLEILDQENPTEIMEFGSGMSTLLIGSWLKEKGKGKLTSIDHDYRWQNSIVHHVQHMQLDKFVEPIILQLTATESFDTSVQWYDITNLDLKPNKLDLILVDGPPQDSSPNRLGRMPVIEKFQERIQPGTIVLLDDSDRENERCILEKWVSLCPTAKVEIFPSISGLAIVRF